MDAADLGPGNAVNSARIAERSAEIAENSEAMCVKPDRTSAKPDLTFESIDKIDATELRSRNYVPTVVKFEAIIGKYWVTAESFDRIDAICVVTVATFAAIGATRVTKNEG
jgi:hypothetical protein